MSRETSKETERLFNEFRKMWKGKGLTDEEADQAFAKFVAAYNQGLGPLRRASKMSADEYLEMAYEAESEEERLELAKKALKADRHCLDARLMIIQLEDVGDAEKTRKRLEKAIKGETKHLEQEGYFDEECIGRFYGLIETRPYMRARLYYVDMLTDMTKYRKAAAECEDLLRLNSNDNMGFRFKLMALYAALEDLEGAEALDKRYPEDAFSMLFPLAILYYKLDDYTKARRILKKMIQKNEEYMDFLTGEIDLEAEDINAVIARGAYRPGTIEEMIAVMQDSTVLYFAADAFQDWASEECLKIKEKSEGRAKLTLVK